jgi:hypothetical protein
MAPIALKTASQQSFSPFTQLESEEDLLKTWRVCTKVKDFLENGRRLENLVLRLNDLTRIELATVAPPAAVVANEDVESTTGSSQ